MEIPRGASYLTVKKKKVHFKFYCIHFMLRPTFARQYYDTNQCDFRDADGGNVSRVEHTCVVEHDRPPAGWAGDVSYMSFNPNVNWAIFDQLLFHDLMQSLLYAPKFFMTAWWTQTALWETESIFLQAWHCADFADFILLSVTCSTRSYGSHCHHSGITYTN